MTQETTIGAPATGGSPGRRNAAGQRPRAPRLAVVPVKHYGRGTFAVIVVLLVLGAAYGVGTNKNFDWAVVGQYVFSPDILRGLLVTLELTVVSMVVAIILAVVFAVMRISESRVLRWVASAYIFFFRGIPLIVLLILVGNFGLFLKTITIGIPGTSVVFFSSPTGQVITPFIAGVIGLSLAGAAYMAEIVRAGLLSVGRGQREAAKALGLNGAGTLRFIVVPQALRIIIPPMGNELIGMLKATAVASVIGSGELLTQAEAISGANYRTIELLIVAAIWYFAVLVVVSVALHLLEKRTAER